MSDNVEMVEGLAGGGAFVFGGRHRPSAAFGDGSVHGRWGGGK